MHIAAVGDTARGLERKRGTFALLCKICSSGMWVLAEFSGSVAWGANMWGIQLGQLADDVMHQT